MHDPPQKYRGDPGVTDPSQKCFHFISRCDIFPPLSLKYPPECPMLLLFEPALLHVLLSSPHSLVFPSSLRPTQYSLTAPGYSFFHTCPTCASINFPDENYLFAEFQLSVANYEAQPVMVLGISLWVRATKHASCYCVILMTGGKTFHRVIGHRYAAPLFYSRLSSDGIAIWYFGLPLMQFNILSGQLLLRVNHLILLSGSPSSQRLFPQIDPAAHLGLATILRCR